MDENEPKEPLTESSRLRNNDNRIATLKHIQNVNERRLISKNFKILSRAQNELSRHIRTELLNKEKIYKKLKKAARNGESIISLMDYRWTINNPIRKIGKYSDQRELLGKIKETFDDYIEENYGDEFYLEVRTAPFSPLWSIHYELVLCFNTLYKEHQIY